MNQQKIIEIVGLLSVVGSLIFVGMEIRNNTAAVRGATQQEVSNQVSEMYRIIIENEKISELGVQATSSIRKSELSKNDYNRYMYFAMMGLRRIENIHLQYRNGFLNENAFDRIGMPFYRLPLLVEIREDQKHAFEPEFAEFFEKLRDGEN